ncbi:MAG: Eco29kI family restriction endonuclease [Thiobacillus sp.]
MKPLAFDRSKHVYRNDAFAELVKDAVRFFNGTPVHPLLPPESFLGTGVYALYYTGAHPLYKEYAALNRLSYGYPIYVGKAVPKGWRQARTSDSALNQSRELVSRLREHGRSISIGADLRLDDFMCRFVIFEAEGSDMINTVESALIKLNRPLSLWNTAVDGFGNHDPGSGRYEQAKSDWDVLHPGRAWAAKCNGKHADKNTVISNIRHHFKHQGQTK